MSVFRTNGERLAIAVDRVLFFFIWIASFRELDSAWTTPWPESIDALVRTVAMTVSVWGILAGLVGFFGIFTSQNEWFQARTRAVFDRLAARGPRRFAYDVTACMAAVFGLSAYVASLSYSWITLLLLVCTFIVFLGERTIAKTRERNAPLGARLELYAPSELPHHAPVVMLTLLPLNILAICWGDFTRTFVAVQAVFWLAFFALARPARAEVGMDGLYIRGFFGLRPRFVPFTAGDAVVDKPWGVEIVRLKRSYMLAGRVARLRFRVADADPETRSAIVGRIRAAVEHARVTEPQTDEDSVLATASHAESQVFAAAAYRAAPMSREALWRIAEASRVEPKLRVHAIERLRAVAEDGDEERLDAIVQGNAEPTTRHVMMSALGPRK